MTLAEKVQRAIMRAGVTIVSVSIGDDAIKATWRVHPASQQTAAQPTIDAFDVNAATVVDDAIATAAGIASSDRDRLADIALMIRYKDIAAWNALSAAQKVAAVLAQQTIWQTMRDFIERNL